MNQNIESEAHVYVDINLPQIGRSPASNEGSKLAIYESTNTSAILANSEDYHLIIERWSIPGFLLPSYIFPNPTEDQLSVQLRYNGEIVEEDVIFTSLSSLSPSSEEYYYVYDFQHLIDMINTALKTAHTNLTTKPVGSLPPFLTYDETGRFRVYGEQTYVTIGGDPNRYYESSYFEDIVLGLGLPFEKMPRPNLPDYYLPYRENKEKILYHAANILKCGDALLYTKPWNTQ